MSTKQEKSLSRVDLVVLFFTQGKKCRPVCRELEEKIGPTQEKL